MVKIGIIGAGMIGRIHAVRLKNIKGAQITGIVGKGTKNRNDLLDQSLLSLDVEVIIFPGINVMQFAKDESDVMLHGTHPVRTTCLSKNLVIVFSASYTLAK